MPDVMNAGKVITYKRDPHGLRGAYRGNPAVIDVLVMGGSTTDERFLHNRET